ncbi:MAG TPA: tetratricopeptide repeat protein [Thermosynechococcaceae cyanobacterium]
MSDPSIAALLEDLQNPTGAVRDRATQILWQLWFGQKGTLGLARLQQAQNLLEQGSLDEAEDLLTDLIESLPDFAEAWNRRALLYYLQRRYRASIADCEQVIRLNPIHFGALHGLGLCHMALGEYSVAIGAFREALKIQPHAVQNQRLILECTAKLS